MSSYEGRWNTVRVDVEGAIAWITLNRPDTLNAINPQMTAPRDG